MNNILQDKLEDTTKKAKHQKLVLLIAAVLAFSALTGFSLLKYMELRDGKGTPVVSQQITPSLKQEEIKKLVEQQTETDRIMEQLQPGTAAAVYIVDQPEPKKDIIFLEKPLAFTDFPSFQSHTSKHNMAFPESLDGFTFSNGSVYREYSPVVNEEDMYQEAARTTKEFIVKPLPMSDIDKQVSATYEKSDSVIVLTMSPVKGARTEFYPVKEEELQKMKVNGNDGVYFAYKHPLGHTSKQLKWVDETNHRIVQLTTKSEAVSKDDLVKMANSLTE